MRSIYDSALSLLTEPLLDLVEDQLSNNDVSDDEEMVKFLVESGLTEDQARRAMQYRTLYLTRIYQKDATPIRSGPHALYFDAHNSRFITDPHFELPPSR